MFEFRGQQYKVHIPSARCPFTYADGEILGIYPPIDYDPIVYAELCEEWEAQYIIKHQREIFFGLEIEDWDIPSDTYSDVFYKIVLSSGKWTCTCKGYYHHGKCKHIKECQEKLEEEAAVQEMLRANVL